MMPMTIVYEMAAIGAVVLAVVFIWYQIKVRKQIRSLDGRLALMQKEIDVLQVQESRRAMMALRAKSKVQAPGIEPDDEEDSVEIDSSDVVRLVGTSRSTPVR
jgi:hypothetical protein